MQIQLYGIRHHGPGSARALLAALEAEPPDLLLIEGPPESEPLLGLVADPRVSPPVALLHYAEKRPDLHLYSPYAIFSPEWQAVRFGLAHGAAIRMIDLPLRHLLAIDERDVDWREDPLTRLAELAGYDDPELWWEQLIEQRPPSLETFSALREAIRTLRAATTEPPPRLELLREAWMRRELRLASSAGTARRIAVVCGAWHLPALDLHDLSLPNELADEHLLTGLPAVDVRSVWVPWSHRQLQRGGGYGAGIPAPGWSLHLWSSPAPRRTIAWLSRAAAILREDGEDISAAQVIDATRLAESLAAIRELPCPGLAEMNEAIVGVMCGGREDRFQLIRDRLVIGESVGMLPDDSPAPPLVLDWQRQCQALRLRPDAGVTNLNLDLRRPLDLRRSRFLHQLDLLEIGWATLTATRQTGTFRESWRLIWQPEVARRLTAAGYAALSIESATRARILEILDLPGSDTSSPTPGLPKALRIFQQILLAGLGGTIVDASGESITHRLAILLDRLTVDEADLDTLLEAFPPLVRLEEYGSIHQQDDAPIDLRMIAPVVERTINRLAIGLARLALPGALRPTPRRLDLLVTVDQAMGLAGRQTRGAIWTATLRQLADSPTTPPGLAGRATLLLWQAGCLTAADLEKMIGRALSPTLPPLAAVEWIDGFFRQTGLLLVQDHQLLELLDRWLAGLDEEQFMATLPLLRRTFATFSPHERRHIAAQLRQQPPSPPANLEAERVALVIPTLGRLLGLDPHPAQKRRGQE
ncbi:MAG: DUF5682 family protein [Acidobacteriota bacterium]